MQTFLRSLLTVHRATAPDGTKSSCRECLRAGGECVLAGSRRGGDFSRFRRSGRNQISTSTCSTPSLGHVEVAGRELTGQMDGYHERGPKDPIYAELTNPGDALQILARLAANGPKIANHQNDSICPDPTARGSSSKGAQTEDISDSQRTLESTRPPVMLSETETLVIGVLGTDTVTTLLHQYETLRALQNQTFSDGPVMLQTITHSLLSQLNSFWHQQTCAKQQLMSRSC